MVGGGEMMRWTGGGRRRFTDLFRKHIIVKRVIKTGGVEGNRGTQGENDRVNLFSVPILLLKAFDPFKNYKLLVHWHNGTIVTNRWRVGLQAKGSNLMARVGTRSCMFQKFPTDFFCNCGETCRVVALHSRQPFAPLPLLLTLMLQPPVPRQI